MNGQHEGGTPHVQGQQRPDRTDAPATAPALIVRELGCRDYAATVARMRAFTDARDATTADELWVLQHPPVFTQGQAGKAEHVLCAGDIPVLQADRGGQITYHGPGQVVIYVLVSLRRLGIGIRTLVTILEDAMIATAAAHGVTAVSRREAPGVYVEGSSDDGAPAFMKIGSLGLRIRRGCSYHGLAFNVDMDLEPFGRIEPCGYPGLRMTQLADQLPATQPVPEVEAVGRELAEQLRRRLTPDSCTGRAARLS